jgi:hypothetical protein
MIGLFRKFLSRVPNAAGAFCGKLQLASETMGFRVSG